MKSTLREINPCVRGDPPSDVYITSAIHIQQQRKGPSCQRGCQTFPPIIEGAPELAEAKERCPPELSGGVPRRPWSEYPRHKYQHRRPGESRTATFAQSGPSMKIRSLDDDADDVDDDDDDDDEDDNHLKATIVIHGRDEAERPAYSYLQQRIATTRMRSSSPNFVSPKL